MLKMLINLSICECCMIYGKSDDKNVALCVEMLINLFRCECFMIYGEGDDENVAS